MDQRSWWPVGHHPSPAAPQGLHIGLHIQTGRTPHLPGITAASAVTALSPAGESRGMDERTPRMENSPQWPPVSTIPAAFTPTRPPPAGVRTYPRKVFPRKVSHKGGMPDRFTPAQPTGGDGNELSIWRACLAALISQRDGWFSVRARTLSTGNSADQGCFNGVQGAYIQHT